MNNIQLLGRITKDLERKVTQSGKSVCSFDIAVTRKFDKEVTDFIPCVAWNKTCETMCKFVKKLLGVFFIVSYKSKIKVIIIRNLDTSSWLLI